MKKNEEEKRTAVGEALRNLGLDASLSRRKFLKISGFSIAAFSTLAPLIAHGAAVPLIIIEQARGIIIADPTKCVACRRCELACTEFNDGKAQPSIARLKVNRNLGFGPTEVFAGQNARGNWGSGLVIQDTCKQCPHPVPCADACPNDAIVVKPPINARVVDAAKCVGCKLCQKACPWEMMSFDPDTDKATKCFLCDGKPKCVEACPAGALRYAAWRDLTDQVPPRAVPAAIITPAKAAACIECHKR